MQQQQQNVVQSFRKANRLGILISFTLMSPFSGLSIFTNILFANTDVILAFEKPETKKPPEICKIPRMPPTSPKYANKS